MIDIFKKVCRQYKIWKPSVATKNILYQLTTREQKKNFGAAHTDKIFYIIRSIDDQSPFYIGPIHNLLANYFYVISHLQYARIKGWIPIVDQLHYPVYNKSQFPIRETENPWEYYWEQPSHYSLEEVYQSRNVVLSKRSWFGQWDMGYDVRNYTDFQTIDFFHELAQEVPLNQFTRQHVQKIKEQLFPQDEKVLGVSFRFGGHAQNSPRPGSGHPIQPSVDELVPIVYSALKKWDMQYIYFASDTEQAVDFFRVEFGDRLIVLPRERRSADAQLCREGTIPMYQQDHIYQTSLAYLTEMELLSQCNGLIGSVTSGLRYAVIQNGGEYEHLEILDYGCFPDSKRNSANKYHGKVKLPL